MSLFWLVTAAMCAGAVAFAVVPLVRARAAAGPTEGEANLEVLRGHRREIEADIAAGTLPADAREEALADLVGRAADDLAPAPISPAPLATRTWPVAGAVAVAVPLLAFGIYLAIGTPQALETRTPVAAGPQLDAGQVVAMVESLAARMKERPDDARGWALLARSMASLERFQESADAYAQLVRLVPGDAQVLADYADVLGMAQGGNLAGRPADLVRQALAIDPRHQKALALAATAAMNAGDYETALGHWRAIAVQLDPGSDDARQLDGIIDDVRGRAAAAGQRLAAAPKASGGKAAPAKAAVSGAAISGSVALSAELVAKISGNETVFILARAAEAQRGPPLAVIRASARDLPMQFALDDSNAMAPGMTISSVPAVRIEARISRSGEVMPRSGDFTGASAAVKPGASGVAVLVDKVLP